MGKKKVNTIIQRSITGAVYIGAIIVSVCLGGMYLHLFFGILTLLTLQEFYAMFRKSNVQPQHILAPILGFLIYASSLLPEYSVYLNDRFLPLVVTVFASLLLILSNELLRKKKQAIYNMSLSIFGIVYIVPPMIIINELSARGQAKEMDQLFPLLGIFILIWAFDTFAYLVGRKLGKHKLLERISPKKSWEGFFGGFFFAILAGLVMAYFLDEQPYLYYAVIAALVAVFSTIGDLIESMIKRSLFIKDSGKILPGHGGLLDRIDSILIVFPVIFMVELIFS
ncbi:MAG: phosphatidate cytidylyltransferase [Crocinitomicaceae bacterium]